MEKVINELFLQAMIYGKGSCMIKERKWYNPMRYIKCKYYQKNINPLGIYKRPPFRTGFGKMDENGHIPNGFGV